MNNTKKVFLYYSYRDSQTMIHKYYTGYFHQMCDLLADLVSNDSPDMTYCFQTTPFEGIEPNRYIKLPPLQNGI